MLSVFYDMVTSLCGYSSPGTGHCTVTVPYALLLQVAMDVKIAKPPKPDDSFVKTFLSGSKCLSGVSYATTNLV